MPVPFARPCLLALVVSCLRPDRGKDEAVKAGWSEVLEPVQAPRGLIPNLVATVKGYAGHERSKC